MKKLLALLLAAVLALSMVACTPVCTEHVDDNNDGKCDICEAPVEKKPCDECVDSDGDGLCDECGEEVEDPILPDGLMTHEQFVSLPVDTEVRVKTYVQAKQAWWDNKGTFYTQAPDGAYFLYNMPCTEDEYNALVPGTCIIVTGYKSAYADEYEIIDASYEIVADDTYIATARDLTSAFASGNDLMPYQNEFFQVKNAIVISEAIYSWDGTGSYGNDLYINLSIGGKSYTFVVESYLYGKGTDVYETVDNLKAGDTINVEAFLYWYNGAQPHMTDVTVTDNGNVSTHADFVAAELNTQHTVITYVQAKQSWWDNKGTFYTQAPDGAYFLYNMPCTQDEYDALVPGTCIMVTGYKSAYADEYELIDATYTILGSGYIAEAADLTDDFASGADLMPHQNELVAIKGAVVTAAAIYSWDGNGSEGNDLYLSVKVGETAYTIVVESYLHGNGSEVYEAVEALEVDDVIDVEVFLYWYNGAQPHINSIVKK